MRPALLVIGHGTKSDAGCAQFAELVERRAAAQAPYADVEGGFLELAPPPIQDAVRQARGRRPPHASTSCRWCSSPPGTARATSRRRSSARSCATPACRSATAVRSGRTPPCWPSPSSGSRRVVPREQWADTAVVLVGRGATDPDANAEIAKVARLLQEGRGIGTVETAFISLAAAVGAGRARPRAAARATTRVVVLPWFLFAGVLPDRIVDAGRRLGRRAPGRRGAARPACSGPGDELAAVVRERWAEIDGGDLRMNCDTCAYRVALPGFEDKVGAPQTPHDHPDDPAHPHGHGHDARPRRTGTPTRTRDARPERRLRPAPPRRRRGRRRACSTSPSTSAAAEPPPWLRGRLERGARQARRLPRPARPPSARWPAATTRPEDEVLLTAGGAEAFVLLARALRPQHAVCVHPSFTEPEAALRAAGHEVHRLVLEPPYVLDPAQVPDDADLVVVGNPTNPTGVVHDAARASCAGRAATVVVDEAFADAVPGEPRSLAGRAATCPGWSSCAA